MVADRLGIELIHQAVDNIYYDCDWYTRDIQTAEPTLLITSAHPERRVAKQMSALSDVWFYGEGPDNALKFDWKPYLRWLASRHDWGDLAHAMIDYLRIKQIREWHATIGKVFGVRAVPSKIDSAEPSWLNREFATEIGLSDRLIESIRRMKSDHPWHPRAVASFETPIWQNFFESFEPALTKTPLDWRVDILVDVTNLHTAEKLLVSAGYVAKHGDASFRKAFLFYQGQYMFIHKTSSLVIDLHWKFVPHGDSFPIDESEIWYKITKTTIGHHDIPTLGIEDTAVFLAAHGTKEDWRSLGWILDFSEFVVRNPQLDWFKLYFRASQKQCGRCILLSAQLAQILFDVHFQDNFKFHITRDSGGQAEADRIIRRLSRRTNAPEYADPWSKLSENRRQRL